MSDNLITMSQEQLTALVDSALDRYTKSLPPVNATPAQVQVTRDEADQPFPSYGDFFKAVKVAGLYPSREDPRLRAIKATGLSEGVPADGGYLVPEELSSKWMEKALNEGEILSRISIDPVKGNSMTYNGVDESTRAGGSVYGGVVGYWIGEGGTITPSKPKFYQLALKLKKLAALVYATEEQLEDTANLQSWITRSVPGALIWFTEKEIASGTGVGKPSGFSESPCVINPLRTGANLVDAADVANMWARRWLGAKDYIWLLNQGVSAQLNQLVISGSYFPAYLPPGGMSAAPYGTLYGRPIIETEFMPALGSTGDITLVSLSQYQAIHKAGGVKSASSMHVAFTTDEMCFKFTYRFDGGMLWNTALTPLNGSTVSPVVALSSASA